MPTTVTFEAGTIADCVKRAARVAPNKVGSAFDKSAGIVFDIDPASKAPVVVRATDTSTFYMEVVDTVSVTGDAMRLRLPSMVLGNVVGSVPSGAGKTVTFDHQGLNVVNISAGRMRAKVVLNLNPHYPQWEPADQIQLTTAPNFGGNITRVEWAASKSGPSPLNGVHIDGQYITATDRYRIARVPCEVELPNGPVTIPAFSIGSLLKQMGDVLVGMDGSLFVIMTDDYTQIKTVVFGDKFPPIERVLNIPFTDQVTVQKDDLIRMIQNAAQFAGADRAPILGVFLGRGEMAVMLENQEVGVFGDVIEVPGQADHKRVKITFTPQMLLSALINAPNPTVTFKYDPAATNRPVCIDGDSGYEVWVAPRGETQQEGN